MICILIVCLHNNNHKICFAYSNSCRRPIRMKHKHNLWGYIELLPWLKEEQFSGLQTGKIPSDGENSQTDFVGRVRTLAWQENYIMQCRIYVVDPNQQNFKQKLVLQLFPVLLLLISSCLETQNILWPTNKFALPNILNTTIIRSFKEHCWLCPVGWLEPR